MPHATVTIPQPCLESWAAMTPTAAGRHCTACQTEVVDFTQLTEAEMLTYLAARPGQQLGRWLLAAAFFMGQPLLAAQLPPPGAAGPGHLTVRGRVLDDSLNVPVPGLFIYLNDTKYGTITNGQGEFTVSFPAGWKPVRGGVLVLHFWPVPYTFKHQQVRLDLRTYDAAQLLTVRLASAPGRGRLQLKGIILNPRPVLPPVYPAGAHAARP